MSGGSPHPLVICSVRAYELVLRAYPVAFAHEYGDSMQQLFRDLAHQAWKEQGIAGIVALWLRVAVDFGKSAGRAYWNERGAAMFRWVVGVGVLYLCTLVAAVGYGAIRYGEYYEPPAFSKFGAPNTHEDVLIAAYEQALSGEFGQYGRFAGGAGLLIAIQLGLGAALFGIWQKSLWRGAFAFIAGAALSVAALHLMPTMWFPLDRYPVAALWVMSQLPTAACAWILVTALGRWAPRLRRATA